MSETMVAAKRKRKARKTPVGAFRRAMAARFLGIGLSTFDRADASGAIPAGQFVNGCKIWPKSVLSLWLLHGSPRREEWEAVWSELRKSFTKTITI